MSYDAGEDDGVDVGVGDQLPADVVVGQGTNCSDVAGDAGLPAVRATSHAGAHGLRAPA